MIIIYNDYTISAVVGKINFSRSYTRASFSCNFLITGESSSDLVTKCNDAELKLGEWNKNFELNFGVTTSTEEYNFSHLANTGFLARPTIKALPSKEQTETSRTYFFAVDFDLPADQAGYDYRQQGNISISMPLQGRKRVTVTGTYTAGGNKTALQNYEDNAISWSNSIAQGVFGSSNYELLDKSTKYEQENKKLDFSIQYQEKLALTVTYNSYTLPGQYYSFTRSQNYTTANYSIDFAIAKTSVSAMLEAVTKKDKKLVVSYGSQTTTFDPANNSGFLATPNVQKKDDLEENSTLEFYTFSVSLQLPATIEDDNYRREGNFSLSFDSSRRKRVNFSVVYTAGGNNSAYANYSSPSTGAKSWAAEILTTNLGFLADNWEIINENVNEEQRNKLVNATFVAQEILSPESSSGTNDIDLAEVQCSYSVDLMNRIGVTLTNSGYEQKKLTRISLQYSAKINRETVVSDTDLHSTYENKVKPWIIQHAKDVLDISSIEDASSTLVATGEKYSVNATNYSITGNITLFSPDTNSAIIFYEEVITDEIDDGKSFSFLWDGKDYTESIWLTGKRRSYNRQISIQKLGSPPDDPPELGGNFYREGLTKKSRLYQDGVGTIQKSSGQTTELFVYFQNFFERYRYVEPTQGNAIIAGQQNEL